MFLVGAPERSCAVEETTLVKTHESPLSGPPPVEIPLTTSPIVHVIAQVRFPLITSIEKREFIARFQESIRRDYPVLRPEQSRGLVLSSEGGLDERTTTSWRFYETSSDWWVTLAPDFLALETRRYSSREDFLDRFRKLLLELVTHIDPKVIDRVGLRYVDRVQGPNLSDLPLLLRPEVSGILATPMAEHARHALSESAFNLPDGTGVVTTRWGLVPARSTVDPAVIEPLESESWLLDIDAFQLFRDTPQALDVETTVAQVRGFAERIYSIFRWAVTDEFLKRYGGQP